MKLQLVSKGNLAQTAILTLPLLLLLPGITGFPYPSAQAGYSDLAISHYPNVVFLRQVLTREHAIPLWSPAILGGYPFAADPLSGLWYPPGWLALILPLPLGFNLLVAAHLLWGGMGMARLLQAEGRSQVAALYGGLAFIALPKLFAHFGAGHLSLLYAVPWTPWFLLTLRGAGIPGGERPVERFDPRPALVLALIFLADPRWTFFAGVLGWVYGFSHSRSFFVTFKRLLAYTGLAILLAALLVIPLLEYTRLSTRATMTPAETLAFSLPAARLLGLVFPDFHGNQEWMSYPGAAVLLLALVSLLSQGRRALWWGLVLALALLFSLGNQIPGMMALARLPLVGWLRVPARALFVSGFALIVLSAMGLDAWLAGMGSTLTKRAWLAIVAATGFGVALAGGVWAIGGKLPISFAWGGAALLVMAAWLALSRRVPARLWIPGLFALSLLDWGAVDRSLFNYHPAKQVLSQGQAAVDFLASQPGIFRVFSPSYSLPQQTAIPAGLELADGIDPLQLRSYAETLNRAAGISTQGYSVTLPPFPGGNPARDNVSASPDATRLGWLNVRYVAAEFDLDVPGLAQVQRFGETRIYENQRVQPRAWVGESENPTAIIAAADILDLSANRIELRATGPGRLVLSEVVYPGWIAWVDDRRAEILPVAGLLRSVELGPGVHTLRLAFRPVSLYTGLGLSALGCGICFGFWLKGRRGMSEAFRHHDA